MSFNPGNLVARAQQNAPLTPFERAFLKFIQGALIGLVIDGGNILLAYYSNTAANVAPVDWVHMLIIPLGTGFIAALLKWLSAQGQAALMPEDTSLPSEPEVQTVATSVPPVEDVPSADTVSVQTAPVRLSSKAPKGSI